jgi:tRNA (adenine37-N6)-methyltransferase
MQKRRGVGELTGVFSLCSPNRPNGIGLSILKLIKVDGNMLHVKNVDILDGTPILDIKPYKPQDYPS